MWPRPPDRPETLELVPGPPPRLAGNPGTRGARVLVHHFMVSDNATRCPPLTCRCCSPPSNRGGSLLRYAPQLFELCSLAANQSLAERFLPVSVFSDGNGFDKSHSEGT